MSCKCIFVTLLIIDVEACGTKITAEEVLCLCYHSTVPVEGCSSETQRGAILCIRRPHLRELSELLLIHTLLFLLLFAWNCCRWFTAVHPLEKRESLIPVPPLMDFEDDLVRSMTTIEPLITLHRHNLPPCPLLLSEEHMVRLLRNTTQPPPMPHAQVVHEGLLEAAAQSFMVAGISDSPRSSRPPSTSGEASHNDSVAHTARPPLERDSPDTGLSSASPARPSVLQRLTPGFRRSSRSSQGECKSLTGSAASLDKGKHDPFRRSASISSAPHHSVTSHRARKTTPQHLSADDTSLPTPQRSGFRHRSFTSSDATGQGLSSSIRRLFRRSNVSSSTTMGQTSGGVGDGSASALSQHADASSAKDLHADVIDTPGAGSLHDSAGSQSSRNAARSDSNHSTECHGTGSRRSSADSNRQRNRQPYAWSKGVCMFVS